jgi:cytochrome c-type biogenesis protein CcmH/NrfG
MQHRFPEAVQQYREAIRLTPDNPQIYINLGGTLLIQGQTNEAIQNYQYAFRLNPDNLTIKAKLQALGVKFFN